MAKIGLVENGLRRRRRTTRRRRNPITAAKGSTAKAKNPARRAVSLASAKAVIKRNGLKTVSRTAANPKRRRHHKRRNGVASATTRYTSRNGIFGNTKHDAKQVGLVLAGAAATKIIGRIASPFLAPYLAQMGIGKYAEIATDTAIALLVVPFLAEKFVGGGRSGGDVGKNARLGSLLVVGLDIIQTVAPSALAYNPFNTSPVVMTGSGAAVTPAAVAQIAAGVANSANPTAAAAKVGQAMVSLDTSGAQGYARPGAMVGSAIRRRRPAFAA